MVIPGLTRISSGEESALASNTSDIANQEDKQTPTAASASIPKIDAVLQAKIAAMRSQMRLKDSMSVEEAVAVPVSLENAPKPMVNYSILDQALANHGFSTIPDSDDEMEVDEVASNSDTSSYVSTDDEDVSSEEDEADQRPLTAEDRRRILSNIDHDDPVTDEIPRTKNEIAEDEEPVQIPDLQISSTEPIELLGTITSIVDKACVVTGAPSPETRVLDVGSLLVFEDRKNLGFVADTFGPVILPMFTVKFRSVEDLQSAGVQNGKMIYVVPKHANYVFSDTLRVKGTDASNIHDEEQSETEFSDDEAEALYKSQKKQQRKVDRNGGFQQRPPRPLNDLESIALAQGLSYDAEKNQMRQQVSSQERNTRGRGTNRGNVRGRGRGRPETNNFGRGPTTTSQSSDSRLDQNVPQSQQSFQRVFYQAPSEDVKEPSPGTITAPQATSNSKFSSVPALYQPLKRPT